MNPSASVHPSARPLNASRPWLARLHPSLFGMVLGMLGLSGAWPRLGHMGVGVAAGVSSALLFFAVILLCLLLFLWGAKAARFPLVVRQEWSHPVQGALLALAFQGTMAWHVVAALTRWRYWAAVPFNVGFWSFSFPLAALAGATVEAVRHGNWPVEVAVTAVVLASGVVAFLGFKTVVLPARGSLLPPV